MMQGDLFQDAQRGLGIPRSMTSKKPEGVGSVRPQAARKANIGEYTAEPLQDGRGRRDTSRAAYAEQRESGKLNNGQVRVLLFLIAREGQSFTRSEIARATGMPLSGVCGRVNELVHIKRVLVEDPRRACRVSGKQAHPVRLP